MNFNAAYISKGFNLNTNHPIQPNAQEYMSYTKYVSIHSEDRDIIKYPNPGFFEIELPEDITNVAAVRLSTWTFPSNYNTFSADFQNINMTFKITNPYNPGENSVSNPLLEATYECLFLTQDTEYNITIGNGFYTPQQMVTELTNRFNEAVTNRIITYFTDNPKYFALLKLFLGYNRFVIVYNEVQQNIWYGNNADGFTLTTSTQYAKHTQYSFGTCLVGRFSPILPDYSNWGLPSNLGLTQQDIAAVSKAGFTPRFYYGDVVYGDNGYWILPSKELGAQVYYIDSPFKINLMGPSYMYMEIDGLNNIDETSPYNVSTFTRETNETNGKVNAAFAKISIPTTPISQWYDRESIPYKYFAPPAERIRRLTIKLRYHNGLLVNFNTFPYSFLLEFTVLQPQILRKGMTVRADNNLINTAITNGMTNTK